MTDPMRVLLLTSQLSPAAGGLAVSVPGLAHSIDRLPDMEMHVFGTVDPNDSEAFPVWGPRVQAFDVKGPQAVQYAPHMGPAIGALAPDIIDVQGLWTYPSLANLRFTKRTRTPYLVTPRGMLEPWARRNSAWKKKIAGAMFETAHLRGAFALRATAEMEAQHFRGMGLTQPIVIVPNGLDLPDLVQRRADGLRSILCLSRIHPKKGMDYLLRSWDALHASFPDWEVVIAGIDENGHEAELKRLAKSLNLPRIRFAGEAHGADKQQLYRDADLFVLPTHSENFGLVVAEALAQETPVITTKNAPWENLGAEGCGWWIDLDQSGLTDTLRGAMTLPRPTLDEMGSKGRAWVRRSFGMSEVAVNMAAVYRWIAGQGARPEFVHD